MSVSSKKVLLLHGWAGKKEAHWLSWLEKELLARDCEVYFPKIPNHYNPNLKRWLTAIQGYTESFEPDWVVTHSLGALAWWHFQSQNILTVEKLISVAPPTFASFASKMSSFFPLPKKLPSAQTHTIIYALDDPNIQSDILQEWALAMGAYVIKKESGEHLDHFSKVAQLKEVLSCLES